MFNTKFQSWVLVASVSLALLSCGKDDPQPTPVQQSTVGSGAAITGVVQVGSGTCAQGPYTVSVLLNGSAQQQQSVSPGASFTFQVNPGTYTVRAQSQAQTSCLVEQSISASQGQTAQVNMTMNQGGYGQQQPGVTNPYNPYQPNPYPNNNPYQPTNPYQPNPFYNGGGYYGGYGYNGNAYPYTYMYGPSGYGYYYWNNSAYVGPCRYQVGGWLCANTF